MTVRIDRRSLLAGAAGLASLGLLGARAAWAQDARIRLMWWGNTNRNERTAKVIELFTAANPGVGRRGRERRLGRLLDPARHADRRRQRAGRHADGLPLHLRVRAPRRPAAARRRDGRRHPRPLGLLRGRHRRRQGRRQDLRHQPRRQLEHDDGQQGGLRGGRRRAAREGNDLGRLCRAGRRADREGRQARLLRLVRRRRRRADLRVLAAPARQGALRRRGQARLRRRRCDRVVRDVAGACATAAPACRPTCRRSTSSPSRRAWSRSATRRSPSTTRTRSSASRPSTSRRWSWCPTRPPAPTPSPASTASRRCSSAPTPTPACRSRRRSSSATSSTTRRRPRCSASSAACRSRRRYARRSRTRSTSSARRRSSSSRTSATSPGRCRRRRRPVPARSQFALKRINEEVGFGTAARGRRRDARLRGHRDPGPGLSQWPRRTLHPRPRQWARPEALAPAGSPGPGPRTARATCSCCPG